MDDTDPVLSAFDVIRKIRQSAGRNANTYVISETEAEALNLLSFCVGLGVLEPHEVKEWNSFLAEYDPSLN